MTPIVRSAVGIRTKTNHRVMLSRLLLDLSRFSMQIATVTMVSSGRLPAALAQDSMVDIMFPGERAQRVSFPATASWRGRDTSVHQD